MPVNHKYLIAPTGTNHVRKPGTQQSWCGRVTVGQAGVRGTNKVPDVLCKRDTMLSEAMSNRMVDTQMASKSHASKASAGVVKPAKVSKLVKAPSGRGKAVSTAVKPVGDVEIILDAADGVSGVVGNSLRTVAKKLEGGHVTLAGAISQVGTTTMGKATSDADRKVLTYLLGQLKGETAQGDVYATVEAFLVANDSAPTLNVGPDGQSLWFEFDSWVYTIYAPESNSNGPDDGWVVSYVPVDEAESTPATLVDEPLSTDSDVINWIAGDTGFKKPRGKRVVKAVADDTTPRALVSSHLVTITSNAAEAVRLAKAGKMHGPTIVALQELQKVADELRKII